RRGRRRRGRWRRGRRGGRGRGGGRAPHAAVAGGDGERRVLLGAGRRHLHGAGGGPADLGEGGCRHRRRVGGRRGRLIDDHDDRQLGGLGGDGPGEGRDADGAVPRAPVAS